MDDRTLLDTFAQTRDAHHVDARRRRHERKASVERSRETTPRVDDDALIALDAALDRLGRRDREVVALRFFDALDVPEIAGRLGVTVGAAKKRLGRAVNRLRRRCRGDVAGALGAIVRPPDVPFVFHPTLASESIAKGTLTMMKHGALLNVSIASTLTLAVIAGLAVAQSAGARPRAVDAPTTLPATRSLSPVELAWNDLAEVEPKASIALLKLADDPDAFVAFANDRLPPVRLTKGELATQLVALGSDDDATWRAASTRLRYFDPRLAEDLDPLMKGLADDDEVRARLVEAMSDRDAGSLAGRYVRLWKSEDRRTSNFADGHGSWWAESNVARLNEGPWQRGRPSWTQVIRGMILLEHLATPAARTIVDAMATGHPDAQPTRVARELIAARATP